MKVHELPGTTRELACMPVANRGELDAGPFDVVLTIGGVIQPSGRASVASLAAGESRELCVETDLPETGQHTIGMVIDETRAVTELVEMNNVYPHLYIAPDAPKDVSPKPAASRADLTVTAIRVNGKEPNGQVECKKGKNDLAVAVKNAGTADAGEFALRLVVDGDDDETMVKQVAELAAGQEREVRFDNVRLKPGGRQLTATADATQAVAESNENNNEKSVSVTCEDDD
jgi:subtilase family serine protease